MEPESDEQLSRLLRAWEAPALPSSLERRVLARRTSWWRFLLVGSVRVPVPVMCAVVLVLAAALWRWNRPSPAPSVVVKTEKMEVPVIRDRVVTKIVYRHGQVPAAEHALTFHELRPVSALSPKILRNKDAQN